MLNYKKVILFPLLGVCLLLTICMGLVSYSVVQLIDLSAKKNQVDVQRYHIVSLINVLSHIANGHKASDLQKHAMQLASFDTATYAVEEQLNKIIHADINLPEVVTIISKVKRMLYTHTFALKHESLDETKLSEVLAFNEQVMLQIEAQLRNADVLMAAERLKISERIETWVIWSVLIGVVTVMLIYMVVALGYQRILTLFKSVAEKEYMVNDLSYQATHDPLTGLVNRRGFESALEKVHQDATVMRRQYGVVFLDLDYFKEVNDTYGHDVGDQLLIEVAKQFSSIVRGNDLLARLGGDEFALIIKQFENESELQFLAGRLIESLADDIVIYGRAIKIGVSIGIATFPKYARTIEALVSQADGAMYVSKRLGKNQFSIATP